MPIACYRLAVKPKTTDLQIRGIPVKTRDALRRKAESNGMTMSRYLVDLIRRDVETMGLEEWVEMMRSHPRSQLSSSVVQRAYQDGLRELYADEADEPPERSEEHR